MKIGFAAFALPRETVEALSHGLHNEVEVLESIDSIVAFVQEHSEAPAILLCEPSALPADTALFTSIDAALRRGWFRILALMADVDHAALALWPASIRRHLLLLPLDDTVSHAEQLLLIAAQLESEVFEATTQELFHLYERAYIADAGRDGGGLESFVTGIRQSVGASAIATYLLDGDGTRLVRDLLSGDDIPRHIQWDWFDQEFVFQHVSRTHKLSASQLGALAQLSHHAISWPVVFVATFRLDGTPICILFVFDELQNVDLKYKICSAASRELFHLYRARDMGATLETLQQLSEMTSSHRDKSSVVWAMLGLLKAHFSANGASLLELTGDTDEERLTFEKTYIHQGRRDKEVFSETTGFAHYCVKRRHALIISHTVNNDGKWFGYGTVYDPAVLLAGAGTPVQLQAYVSPKSVEVERSVLYYPLISQGVVSALLKIGDFHREHAYNIRHLKQISTLSLPVASFIDDVNTIAILRARVEHESENKKLVELANTLFLYREIALGMFHQVTNHTNRVESELMLVESLVSSEHRSSEIGTHVSVARDVVREAKGLIRKAQQRGRSLTPITEKCQLVDDIVRPALKYIERDHPEITLRHSLTNRDYTVEVDPGYMREGLYNLLNNAIWAVKQNRGSKREIFVAVRPLDNAMIRLHVEDSGIGIESEFRPNLFKPFATTRPDGTGLGLFFAKQLIEHFGGRLELERSQPGRGSVFVVTLPSNGDVNVTASH